MIILILCLGFGPHVTLTAVNQFPLIVNQTVGFDLTMTRTDHIVSDKG